MKKSACHEIELFLSRNRIFQKNSVTKYRDKSVSRVFSRPKSNFSLLFLFLHKFCHRVFSSSNHLFVYPPCFFQGRSFLFIFSPIFTSERVVSFRQALGVVNKRSNLRCVVSLPRTLHTQHPTPNPGLFRSNVAESINKNGGTQPRPADMQPLRRCAL